MPINENSGLLNRNFQKYFNDNAESLKISYEFTPFPTRLFGAKCFQIKYFTHDISVLFIWLSAFSAKI